MQNVKKKSCNIYLIITYCVRKVLRMQFEFHFATVTGTTGMWI